MQGIEQVESHKNKLKMDSPTLPIRQLALGVPVSPSRPPRLSMVNELVDHEEDGPTPATPSLKLQKSAVSLSETSVASTRHSTPQPIQRSPLNYPSPATYSPSHSSSSHTHRISTYHYHYTLSQHAPPSPASSTSIAPHSPPSPTRSFTRLSPPSPAGSFVVKSRLLRSQVSMDAVQPSQPAVSPVSVYSELPSPSAARMRRTSDMNTSIPHMLRHDAEQDEDEIRGYAETHRAPVDHALRSAPGVVGLGDGWAGGPQPRNRKRWFRRSVNKGADEQDPLALWVIDQSGEAKQSARSPFKAMWNRSKTFFTGSTPVLGADTNRSPRYRGFFSPSKNNFTSASRDGKASITGLFSLSRSRDGLNKTKSASQLSVPGSAFPIPPPRSKPIMGRNAFARSLPLLSSFSSSPNNARPWPSLPRRESVVWPSSPRRESAVWPSSPPRRESAVFPTAAHSVQTPIIPEMDERQDSASSSSLETPQTPRTSRHAQSKEAITPVKTLRRSATFGANDITRELGIRDEDVFREHATEETVGLDTLALWANEGRSVGRDRTDRTSTIPTPIAFVPLNDERPSRSSRPRNLLGRLRTSLTPSQSSSTTPSMSSRTSSPSPLRSIRRKAKPRSATATPTSRSVPLDTEDPAYQITRHAVAHALDTPPKERPSDKKQRRVTWRGTGGSKTWLKRLSKLTESDETETAPSNRWSFMEHMTPARTSSLASLHVLSKKPDEPKRGSTGSWARPIPASVSMPALHLDLPIESGLGLDDILDPERRARFVQSTHQRESGMQSTHQRESDMHSTSTPGRRHETHSRWTSEPLVIPSRTSSIGGGGHMRNRSVPSDTVPTLESAISNPASAPDEPVVTPRSSNGDFPAFAPLSVPRPLFAQQPRVEFTRPPRVPRALATPSPRSPVTQLLHSPLAKPLHSPPARPARLALAQDAPVWDLTERSESNSPQPPRESSPQSPQPPYQSAFTHPPRESSPQSPQPPYQSAFTHPPRSPSRSRSPRMIPRSPRTQAARLSFVQDGSVWDLTDSIESHLQATGDLPPLLPSPPSTPVKSFEWNQVRRGSAFSEGSQASLDSDTGPVVLQQAVAAKISKKKASMVLVDDLRMADGAHKDGVESA